MSLQDPQEELRRYSRRTRIGYVAVLAVLAVAIGGLIAAATIAIKHDNEFAKQCNAEGGWVASHDPLICIKGDKVIRIDQ